MNLLILNGPNLNLLGKREPTIYGHQSFDEYYQNLKTKYQTGTYISQSVVIDYYQSNHEGDLIDKIQEADGKYDGIILNAGGYTHTSVAIHDAIMAVSVPVVEVHISNIAKREEYRKTSYISSAAEGTIMGLGLTGYELAIKYFINNA